MKKSIIFIALIIGLSTLVFANNNNETDKKKTEESKELTVEQAQLLTELEAQEANENLNVDQILAGLTEQVERVLVYDLEGNLLVEQNEEINLEALRQGADLLMKEGTTQFYIVQ